jgi:hypothetical protein
MSTNDTLRSLQTQLANSEESLALIQERKSEYPLRQDVPLQLIQNERALKERIENLKAQIAALQQPSSSTQVQRAPAAFMSYATFNDAHDSGMLTQLRERLSAEVQAQTGEPFKIFQDRTDIRWGEDWQQRINESLDSVTFLIPIITPSFFKSQHCRAELERFMQREQQLGRSDLILPIYYINYPPMNDRTRAASDKLLQTIIAHQYEDWRELRFEMLDAPIVRRKLAHMAEQISAALERSRT